MRSLIDDTPQLQYKVELYLAGMVETRFTEGDIHGALSKLRLQEEAWSRFQPLQEFDVPSSAGRPVKRNILIDNARHSATFHQLPPKPLWKLPLRWSLNFDFAVHGIHVYPEDNLLVAVEPLYASTFHALL